LLVTHLENWDQQFSFLQWLLMSPSSSLMSWNSQRMQLCRSIKTSGTRVNSLSGFGRVASRLGRLRPLKKGQLLLKASICLVFFVFSIHGAMLSVWPSQCRLPAWRATSPGALPGPLHLGSVTGRIPRGVSGSPIEGRSSASQNRFRFGHILCHDNCEIRLHMSRTAERLGASPWALDTGCPEP
jgi:hypothetical protein